MPSFKCLYYFTSSDVCVAEIKRTDLPESSHLSDVYKWLILAPQGGRVLELDFQSMEKGEHTEYRTFTEGKFHFSASEGHLSFLGKRFSLERKNQDTISSESTELIRRYLSEEFPPIGTCGLRSLRPSDVSSFKRWIADEEVIRYSMTKFHRLTNEGQMIDWFRSTLLDSKTFQVGIVDPPSKRLIGYAGIASINEIDGNGEFFILVGEKEFWGRGIASSVTKEILTLGFKKLDLHRIFLTASSKNPGAIRAYEKAGFVHEGRMREAFYRNHEFSDKLIMGVLKRDFKLE